MTTFLLAALVARQFLRLRHGSDRSRFEQSLGDASRDYIAGNRPAALRKLELAEKQASRDPAEHLELAGRFEALGQRGKAAQHIEQMLRLRPECQNVTNFAHLATYCLEQGEIEQARRLLAGDLIPNWPNCFETVYLRGVMALQDAKSSNDVMEAREWFEQCERLRPDDLGVKIQLGIAHERLGQVDQAEPLLRAAVAADPMNKAALYHLGQVLRLRGKAAEAEKCLTEHQRLCKLSDRQQYLEVQYSVGHYKPADLLELARIYTEFGQWKRAASVLRLFTRLEPTDPAGHLELAGTALKLGDKETARIEGELARALRK
jgi:Flp pilus assembly protein TadD